MIKAVIWVWNRKRKFRFKKFSTVAKAIKFAEREFRKKDTHEVDLNKR